MGGWLIIYIHLNTHAYSDMRTDLVTCLHNHMDQGPYCGVVRGALPFGHQNSLNAFYLEGQGDLVNGLIMGITRVTIWVIGDSDLLTKSP